MPRVLVVDDDPTIRQVIALALGDEGYTVDEAADGTAALALIAQQYPDLILLDMKMPGTDGWEFVRRYRASYERQAPIVVLTAAPDVAERGEAVHAAAYLAKPFDLDALLACVAAFAG